MFSDYFNSKRRIKNKRFDRYFEHRNTLVQIEHESIPLRLNLHRNLTAITDAIDNSNENSIRFILRFYPLSMSSGLGLKMLNLEIINTYYQLYVLIETINSGLIYVDNIVKQVLEDRKLGQIDESLLGQYILLLEELKVKFQKLDRDSLHLLSKVKAIMDMDDSVIKKHYIATGDLIIYSISDDLISTNSDEVVSEETREARIGEDKERFVSLYLDMHRVQVR